MRRALPELSRVRVSRVPLSHVPLSRVRLSRARVVSLLVASAAVSVLAPVLLAPPAVAATVPPGATNTGVPAGAHLTRIDGTVVLNRAGATYSNLDIHGRVRVKAPNITLVNSIVRGDASHINGELIDCYNYDSDHHGFVLRDSTLLPTYKSLYQKGIVGHDFSVLRSNISGTVDAVHVAGGNVTVTSSWLHDTFYVSAAQSPTHRATHNDGVQIVAGANVTISGNTIANNSNSAMQITQDDGPVSNVRFTGNWSSGGGCTVNMVAKPRGSMGGISVTGNWFKHNTSVANCAIIYGPGVSASTGGNVWSDTGRPVTVSRGS